MSLSSAAAGAGAAAGASSQTAPIVDAAKLHFSTFDEGWKFITSNIDRLEEIVDSQYSRVFSPAEYSMVYSVVYNLSIAKGNMAMNPHLGRAVRNNQPPQETNQDRLYKGYKEWIEGYLERRVVPAIRRSHASQLLSELCIRWENHKIIVKWLTKLFAYLDRYYTNQADQKVLRDVGMDLFRSMIFENVRKEVMGAVLEKIQEERNGDAIDRAKLKSAIEVFVEMGMSDLKVYRVEFEEPFLKATHRYYHIESANWLTTDSCPEYMLKAEQRLAEEDRRVDHYLHKSTRDKLMRVVEDELLKVHQETLLHMANSGFLALLRAQDRQNLALMYRLFHRLQDGIAPVASMFKDEIRREGEAAITDAEAAAEFDGNTLILALLAIQHKYLTMVKEEFENSNTFHRALKEAFETFVNNEVKIKDQRVLVAEVLAQFCDTIMRPGREKYSNEDIDELFEKVVHFFQYVHDKDFFHESYRKLLAKRLLDTTAIEEDAERNLISKLKMRLGAAFTNKLETMITDRNMSAEQMQRFRDYLTENHIRLPIKDFQALVLTTGSWPQFPVDTLNATEDLQYCLEKFREFYSKKTTNRVLQWIHSMAKATLVGHFACGKRDMTMTGYQAAVCMLFNRYRELSITQIQEMTNIDIDEVKRAVMGLCAGKFQILNRTQSSKALAGDDTLTFNEAFETKRLKINIPLPKILVKKGGTAGAPEPEQERRYMIDAGIVRVMKARRTLTHAELVSEVLNQLTLFKPQPRQVKTRIEDLIMREFLKRDERDASTYHYVA